MSSQLFFRENGNWLDYTMLERCAQQQQQLTCNQQSLHRTLFTFLRWKQVESDRLSHGGILEMCYRLFDPTEIGIL